MSNAASDVAAFARLLIPEGSGHVAELRALNVPQGGGRTATCAGYFDDPGKLASSAAELDEQGASGTYVTLNPVQPDLLARAVNRVETSPMALTRDHQALRRTRVLLDWDPVRPSGVSATDEEKAHAKLVSARVLAFLRERGIEAHIYGDSGNGYHAILAVDLPVDDSGLVRKFLAALARRFDTEEVTVDRSVANPSRITKFFGTMARKGHSTPDRPHRRSSILRRSDAPEIASAGRLEAIVAELALSAPTGTNRPSTCAPRTTTPSIARIRDALRHIPADDRDVWIRVGMALHHGLPASLAYDLWSEWSLRSSKFEQREQDKAWRSFKSDRNNPVTLGTVYALARAHGWRPRRDRRRGARVVHLRRTST